MSREKPSKLSTRFQLDENPLGCGAFGCVYRAYDTVLKCAVAIKIPHDDEKEGALRQEAGLMARIRALNEPHVVLLYDLHEVGGREVIVMEFVDGEPLRARVGNIGAQMAMETGLALDIVIQVCVGLTALHNAFEQESIFHRDIKPENIMIRSSDGLVKIADFGIARLLDASGYASTTAGTLPYMSPELLRSYADHRADIYGLGVVLYEMTAGQLPFSPIGAEGKPKPALVYGEEICRGNARSPCEIADVPEELGAIIMRALCPEVEERLQSAQELHDSLVAFRGRTQVSHGIAEAWKEETPKAQEQALEDIVKRHPCVESFHALAEFYIQRYLLRKALQVLRDGMNRCDTADELLVDLAMVYHQLGQKQQAIEALQNAKSGTLSPKARSVVEKLLKAWQRNSVE